MRKGKEVPITRQVLHWAIEESGISGRELADKVGVSQAKVQQWVDGSSLPSLSNFRRLASSLHRPTALFLLPAPPKAQRPAVKFRQPAGGQVRAPNPVELRALRQAARLQRVLAWITGELGIAPTDFPHIGLATRPEDAAQQVRTWCDTGQPRDLVTGTPSQAFDAWRDMIETRGVLVCLASLGGQSCRGFSLWDHNAPIITPMG